MCEICGKEPCHTRCPNAPEEKSLMKCDYCNEDIYLGEDYFLVNGQIACDNCCYLSENNDEEVCAGCLNNIQEGSDCYIIKNDYYCIECVDSRVVEEI